MQSLSEPDLPASVHATTLSGGNVINLGLILFEKANWVCLIRFGELHLFSLATDAAQVVYKEENICLSLVPGTFF